MLERLEKQFTFLKEMDKLKGVLRRTILTHDPRRENSGEHSWHVAMVAMILSEYADESIDVMRVVKMLLIHDIVEIDAGDVYIYDKEAQQNKFEDELTAAERIFGLLPEDQAEEFKALWIEFEKKETPDAKFAGTCDRLIPLLHNYWAEGHTWQEHGIGSSDVYEINSCIADGSSKLWDEAKRIIEESIECGYLPSK